MIKIKIFSLSLISLMVLMHLNVCAKKVPVKDKRSTYHYSLEYVNSFDTFNRSMRALGYDVNQLVYGIQGENCSPSEGDVSSLSKGSFYGLFGYQFLEALTFAGMAGYGDSYHNEDKLQYGAMCSLHIKFVNLSITYNTTSNWGFGFGIYLK
ncbi:hypothetical protein K5X82_13080 [Halosquirtibacter xylanolyticus]|uniref:hypothetical protein n=1 Tax=Halosquirtibacter xylanolyticus TaxID=3374599 RepID=UPI00374A14CD|nr:hypothetical protein K5X82_13080 [Prolixibacteraceae bacterium]